MPRKRSEESRQAILDASLALLRERPYGEVTSDAIARAAGVGKQTIYRWWQTKAEVVLEALSETARAVASPQTGSLEGDVRAFFESTTRLLRGPHTTAPILRGLMAEAQLDPGFLPKMVAFVETRRCALREVLLRHTSPGAHVEAAIDMLFGALWYRLLLGHLPIAAGFARDVAAVAARGLSAREG